MGENFSLEMLQDGLGYPFKGSERFAKHLLGGVLVFFGWLLIPLFFLAGYYMSALNAVARGDDEPPSFGDWGKYFVDGLKAFGVSIVYSFIPVVFVVVGLLATGVSVETGGGAGVFVGMALPLMGAMVVLNFLVSYFLPGAITHVAVTGRFGSAFSVSELKSLWFSQTYLVAAVVYFVGAIILTIGFWIGSVLTLGIGFILYPFFMFYLYLFGAYVFGSAYREVFTLGSDTPTESSDSGDGEWSSSPDHY